MTDMNMKQNDILQQIRAEMDPVMKKRMEFSVEIANRVFSLLEEKGMSQKDLARKMGKTETEVSRWLSGMHNLTLGSIAKLSIALEKDIIKWRFCISKRKVGNRLIFHPKFFLQVGRANFVTKKGLDI